MKKLYIASLIAYLMLSVNLAYSEGLKPISEVEIAHYLRNKATWGVACEFTRNNELVIGTARINFDKKKISVIWFKHYYGSYDKQTYKDHFTPDVLDYYITHININKYTEENFGNEESKVFIEGTNISGNKFSALWTTENKFELIDKNRGIKITNISKKGREIQNKFFPEIDLQYPH